MMRAFAAASILAVLLGAPTHAAPARAPETAAEFVARCKTDEAFCRRQIMAVEVLLEREKKSCLPASVTKEAMAARVQDVIEDVLEEDADSFKDLPYRPLAEQLISFLWPCEPIA